MTFHDTLHMFGWPTIENVLFTLYPEERDNVVNYGRIFYELKSDIPPTGSDLTLHIETFEEDGESYEDVHAYRSGEDTVYAIDFIPWSEVLSMPIAEETLAKYSIPEIVSHILWEITFHGDSAESVAEKFSELQSRKEEMLRQLGE